MNKIVLKHNHLTEQPTHESWIKDYLSYNGIKDEDFEDFLNKPKVDSELNPRLLNNIEHAVEVAYQHLSQAGGCKIYVQPDSDTDGFTSSSILINYIHTRFPSVEICFELHKGKEHGIILKNIPDDVDTVFIPDAGSNDFEQQETLVAAGKTVIILDHHNVNEIVDTGAIVVNNQLSPNFPNKNLSGAGVVYKFIQLMDETYFSDNPIYTNYADLAAVGIIADNMDMRDLDNNFIAFEGLNHIHSLLLSALATKQARGIKDLNHLTKINVMFYIAPVINGVIRYGTDEDKLALFTAMCDNSSVQTFERDYRGKHYVESLYEYATRLAVNAKSRQDNDKKKAFSWLCEKIRAEKLDKDNIIIVTLNAQESSKVSANITGLIAMELVKEFNRPAIVTRLTTFEDKELYGGSGRNGVFFGFPSLMDFLKESGLVYYVAGHDNAHGVFIEKDKIQALRDYANSHLSTEIFTDDVTEVDYIFDNKFNSSMLLEFAKYEQIWGTGLRAPIFCFNVNVNPAGYMLMGADKSSIKIKTADGVDFVIFKDPDLAEKLQNMAGQLRLRIIGEPSINEFNGRVSVQVMVKDYEVLPNEEIKPISDITETPVKKRTWRDLI